MKTRNRRKLLIINKTHHLPKQVLFKKRLKRGPNISIINRSHNINRHEDLYNNGFVDSNKQVNAKSSDALDDLLKEVFDDTKGGKRK